MTLQLKIIDSVEKLGYRVTVGDVVAYSGISSYIVQKELLSLVSDTLGNLQVTQSGEIIYVFSRNLRSIFRNKNLMLRLNEIWKKIWIILFYLIRISFGVILISSIIIVFTSITIIITSLHSDRERDDGYRGINFFLLPNLSDLFWIFYPTNNYHSFTSSKPSGDELPKKINFLEAVFSFLFGDGNPNFNLEEIRWEMISRVIYDNQGVIIAEQIAPYLDYVDEYSEDHILPILKRFAGVPIVSPKGQLIYSFPELRTFVENLPKKHINNTFEENLYQFTRITISQKMLVISLGAVNFILVLVLGSLLKDQSIILEANSLIGFTNSLYWFLFSYASLFLGLPLVRYFVIQSRNVKINKRNLQRKERLHILNKGSRTIKHKLCYVNYFLDQEKVNNTEIAYSTEEGVIEQSDTIGLDT